MPRSIVKSIAGLTVLFCWAAMAAAQPAAPLPGEAAATDQGVGQAVDQANAKSILDLDIEQLSKVQVEVPSMDIEVSSVAKQESTVGRSPAAVFVVTPEMIRRNGATNIPELLRMVPGLEVARMSSSIWHISARGFNSHFANKLLVLIDGRTVYTPLFSGVNWDVQDVLLEDVERIEVIRGPGGTLWGANAVNGVINIITKKAKQTQGALITSGGGSEDRAINGIRYGGQIGRGLYWRIYGKHFDRDQGFAGSAQGHHGRHGPMQAGDDDDWRMGRGGFRLDWEPHPQQGDTLSVQGDFYGGQAGHSVSPPTPDPPDFKIDLFQDVPLAGANVLGRWTRVLDEASDWTVQLYYDRTFRERPILREEVDTFDVDFQHRFPLGCRHRIIWGTGYRHVDDQLSADGFAVDVTRPARITGLFSAFVQDEIMLAEDRLYLTVGSKFEKNDFTGFEYQPSARLLWTPDRRHSGWASISRAVRTPSRFDHSGRFTQQRTTEPGIPGPFFPRVIGSSAVVSEQLMAYEIGFRAQASKQFAWDLATFYNAYENLATTRPGSPFVEGTNTIVPFWLVNDMGGETYGVELSGNWTISDRWRLAGSYNFLQMQLHSGPNADPHVEIDSEGGSPHNQVRFYSYWDLPRGWEFDLGLRYVDNLPTLGVDDYITMDIRLGWAPNENFEVSVVGQNLLDSYRMEIFHQAYPFSFHTNHTAVERGVFAKVTWRY